MRHAPLAVGRVAGEAAAEMVVDAAGAQRVEQSAHRAAQGAARGRGTTSLHRKRKIGALGNFGAPLRPPLTGSRMRVSASAARARSSGARSAPDRRRGEFGEMGDEPGALFAERRALVAPRRVDGVEHLRERRPSPTRRRRPVGAAEERRAVGREEHRHRPAALLAHRMQRRHVERVDVRPLLAIDLDVDEQLVHQRRDRRVLERLVRHDVAPVAGGVADRQQDRAVAALRLRERLGSPRPPMDRVAGVLQQIGRGRAGEPVSFLRHDGLPGALAGQDGRAVAAAQGAADRLRARARASASP